MGCQTVKKTCFDLRTNVSSTKVEVNQCKWVAKWSARSTESRKLRLARASWIFFSTWSTAHVCNWLKRSRALLPSHKWIIYALPARQPYINTFYIHNTNISQYPQFISIIYIMYTFSHSLHITSINWTRSWPSESHWSRGGRGFESRWSLKKISGFICNCLSCFTTAKITFTCILYP